MLSHRIWVKYLAGAQSFTTVALFALYGYAAPGMSAQFRRVRYA